MNEIQIATLVLLNIAIIVNVYELGKRRGRKQTATIVNQILNATLKGLKTKEEASDDPE